MNASLKDWCKKDNEQLFEKIVLTLFYLCPHSTEPSHVVKVITIELDSDSCVTKEGSWQRSTTVLFNEISKGYLHIVIATVTKWIKLNLKLCEC